MYQSNPRLGALLMIGAGAAFATMGAFIKVASEGLPNSMVVFLRCLFGLLLVSPWLMRRSLPGLRTEKLHFLLLRTLFGLSAMVCFFWAIPRLHLAEAVLLNYSQPLFIPFIAWAWLKEKPDKPVFLAIVIGFIGVALILKPSAGLVSPAGLVGLSAGVFAALAMVTIRRMADTEPTTRIVFYYALFATIITATPLPWTWQAPTSTQWLAVAAASTFGTGGQMLLTRAYALAPAARVGALIYASVVFAGLYGWLFWGETLDRYTLIGTILVIGAGVLAIRRRRRPGRRRVA